MVLSYERKLRRHKEYKKQICDGKGRIMEKHKHERSTFSGKIGFVLSAAGASVGLGNIWRFPYLAAKYGGGIFLLIYIIPVSYTHLDVYKRQDMSSLHARRVQ